MNNTPDSKPSSNLKVAGSMTSQGADKAGVNLSYAAIIGAVLLGVAAIVAAGSLYL